MVGSDHVKLAMSEHKYKCHLTISEQFIQVIILFNENVYIKSVGGMLYSNTVVHTGTKGSNLQENCLSWSGYIHPDPNKVTFHPK